MRKSNYKNVVIPTELVNLIPHMADVEGYREELRTIAGQWDLLTILGKMSGTGSDMSDTQKAFQVLTDELLGHLAMETLKKTIMEIGAIGQVAVDILIRNLFERTADIGFLATDEDIRQFTLDCQSGSFSVEKKRNIIQRFKEYVAKYSVYYNIILMDPQGNILVQLDEESELESSNDPLIQEALETSQDFVEVFRHSDLNPKEQESLIYAYRVTENNDPDSQPLGVLCLCFRFENEMKGIFANLLNEADWAVITILDADGKVIASSDKYQIPHGAELERVLSDEYKIVRFSGREYLAKTCATKGYQGFYGLGWQGHVMLPLDHAFRSEQELHAGFQIDENVLHAVMKDPNLFSKELRNIPIKAETIQKDLDRTVWNGNVQQNTSQSKVLLWNISAAGEKTKKIFESSIGNLHQTVVSTILDDVNFQAALAVDIMDRNLYERANDCRWWALTSDFKKILDQDEISADDSVKITEILKYINGLYTVYTNLFVYDKNGKVIAVSNKAEEKLVGKVVHSNWIKETLSLTDSQAYSVSDFERSSLYGDLHTYIYGASITSLDSQESIVGGIGIVFDSFPQFEAMLIDCLPRTENGEIRNGFFGVFCDRNRNIISSSSHDVKVGEKLDIDKDLFSLDNGQGTSRIIQFNQKYYAVGCRTSSGYREYKKKDKYINDVIALFFAPLGAITINEETKKSEEFTADCSFANSNATDGIEVATFAINNRCYAFRTSVVVKAMDVEGLTEIPGSHELLLGKILDDKHAISVIDFLMLTTHQETVINKGSQIIVVEGTKGRIGLVVDALGPIPVIPEDKIDLNTSLLDRADKFTEGVMLPENCQSHHEMVVLLDVDRLEDFLAGEGTFNLKEKSLIYN